LRGSNLGESSSSKDEAEDAVDEEQDDDSWRSGSQVSSQQEVPLGSGRNTVPLRSGWAWARLFDATSRLLLPWEKQLLWFAADVDVASPYRVDT
jgi:hypothetical protein